MTFFSAIALFFFGTAVLYFIGRRRFARRNLTGLEGFRNFETAFFTRISEALCRLLAWLMILAGILLGLVYLYNNP